MTTKTKTKNKTKLLKSNKNRKCKNNQFCTWRNILKIKQKLNKILKPKIKK